MEQNTMLGVDLLEVVEADAPLGQGSEPHGLDDRIGAGHQLLQYGYPRFRAEVQDERALASVEVEVHQRDALYNGPRHLADVIPGRRLDLDHLGTQVD
jgi:hypothetical protein